MISNWQCAWWTKYVPTEPSRACEGAVPVLLIMSRRTVRHPGAPAPHGLDDLLLTRRMSLREFRHHAERPSSWFSKLSYSATYRGAERRCTSPAFCQVRSRPPFRPNVARRIAQRRAARDDGELFPPDDDPG